MYKLTYDSEEENVEVNAEKTEPRPGKAEDITMATKPKEEIADSDEAQKDAAPATNKKRTKDNFHYQGNGRFYSLFANDTFVTEDPKASKTKCGVSMKMIILVLSLLAMTAGILCLLVVVKNLQDQQEELKMRLDSLEAAFGQNNPSVEPASSQGEKDQLLAPPMPPVDEVPPFSQSFLDTADCCVTNGNKIGVLRTLLARQTNKIVLFESKMKRHVESSDVRFSELLRKQGENSKGLHDVLMKISDVRTELVGISSVANAAKSMALVALKETGVDEAEYQQHLDVTHSVQATEVTAFGVAHALKMEHVIAHDGPPLPGDDNVANDNGGMYYAINPNSAPTISFDHSTIGGGRYFKAESGIFHAPSDGKYVIMVNFCTEFASKTSVSLINNDVTVREMKVGLDLPSQLQHSPVYDESPPLPPHMDQFAPPLPMYDEASQVESHYFSELVDLSSGDSLYLKITSGNIVEYKELSPVDSLAPHSCTRFSGFRIK